MPISEDIINSVKAGKCILFLGAMASAAPPPEGSGFHAGALPPSGRALSEKLAAECKYPYEDKTNLAHVSLFYQWQEGKSRQALVKAVEAEVAAPHLSPSPALHMLAALPFRITITTNYDQLYDQALFAAKTLDGLSKKPRITIYDPKRDGPPESVPLDPLAEQPILIKLHGDITKPESIVITEEDYITFIQRMAMPERSPIHEKLRARMMEWPTLFIGYSLKDYNLRLLFKTLRWKVDEANYPLSFSVDPFPDNLIVAVWQRSSPPLVSFIEEDLWQFVPALYKAVIGRDYEA
jgi:hypothetical protein